MERANIVIIGGGVVGLAIAAKLSELNKDVFIFEKNKRVGQEVSSHNSGVIHSGIHYPRDSLKAELCVKGNRKMYDLCGRNRIPYKRLGKLTVARGEREIKEIEKLKRQGEENGILDLELLDSDQIKKMEPNVAADRALYSPSSGIVEPDELMNYYQAKIGINGAIISTNTVVKSIRKGNSGYEITARNSNDEFVIVANTVINSAGLYADRVAEMAGLDVDRLGYRLHYCKGDYFRITGTPLVRRLVYPVPAGAGLGIHLTPDISGSIKMGPNSYYVDKIDYRVETREEEFRKDVRGYLPSIDNAQINEDSSGIRPKIQGPNDSFKDFVIMNEEGNGLPGLINLIGIESPGLTASPAISDLISEMYENEVK